MAVLPEAVITHATTCRTRLRIPAKRGDDSYFSNIFVHIANLDGVEHVETNSRLGSILIRHQGDPKAIFRQAEDRHLFFVETNEKSGPPVEGTLLVRMREKFDQLDQRTVTGTQGRLDMASIGFLTLLGAAGYDFLRGNFRRAPWYAALWYASAILFGPAAKPSDESVPEE